MTGFDFFLIACTVVVVLLFAWLIGEAWLGGRDEPDHPLDDLDGLRRRWTEGHGPLFFSACRPTEPREVWAEACKLALTAELEKRRNRPYDWERADEAEH